MDKFFGIVLEIASAILPGFTRKIYEGFNKKYTVSTVYPNGKVNWVFNRNLKKACEIKQISLGGASFFKAHTETIRAQLENGCNIKVLVCGNEEYLKQTDIVVGSPDIEFSKKTVSNFESELQWLLVSQSENAERIKSKIEVRYYDLEFRKVVTIIKDTSGKKHGYVSVSLIPEAHRNSPLIKFKKDRCSLAEAHFDKIWTLHEEDKVSPFIAP